MRGWPSNGFCGFLLGSSLLLGAVGGGWAEYNWAPIAHALGVVGSESLVLVAGALNAALYYGIWRLLALVVGVLIRIAWNGYDGFLFQIGRVVIHADQHPGETRAVSGNVAALILALLLAVTSAFGYVSEEQRQAAASRRWQDEQIRRNAPYLRQMAKDLAKPLFRPHATADQATEIAKDAANKIDWNRLDQLTSAEKQRFREICLQVLKDPDPGTPSVELRQEFHGLLRKLGPWTDNDLRAGRELLLDANNHYMRYLYEDALVAVQTGRPFKGLQREAYEKRLQSLGVLSDWRIRQNETFVEKVAKGEPQDAGAGQIVFTKELIDQLLAQLGEDAKRIELLWTPP